MCVCPCITHMSTEVRRGHGIPWNWRATMWVLGIKPELSIRLASALNTEPLVLNFKNIFCLLVCWGCTFAMACGSQGSNLDCQAWWQVSLLTEPTY